MTLMHLNEQTACAGWVLPYCFKLEAAIFHGTSHVVKPTAPRHGMPGADNRTFNQDAPIA
jgi:hypothetical protein